MRILSVSFILHPSDHRNAFSGRGYCITLTLWWILADTKWLWPLWWEFLYCSLDRSCKVGLRTQRFSESSSVIVWHRPQKAGFRFALNWLWPVWWELQFCNLYKICYGELRIYKFSESSSLITTHAPTKWDSNSLVIGYEYFSESSNFVAYQWAVELNFRRTGLVKILL